MEINIQPLAVGFCNRVLAAGRRSDGKLFTSESNGVLEGL
jgi:hypothetical protein